MCLAYQSGKDSVDDIVKGVENGDILLSNNIQKGNYGEMNMDVYFKSQGYDGPMSRFSTS